MAQPHRESRPKPNAAAWRHRWHEIIFEADTRAGKIFDIILFIAIALSVLVVMLDSVAELDERYGDIMYVIEWIMTILFTIEYILRLVTTIRPMRYAFSFFGIVDFLAVLPTYMELLLPGLGPHAMVIRVLRLIRVFRVFKLARFLSEAETLKNSVLAARAKIAVFLMVVLCVVVIMGAAMHLVEGQPDADGTPATQFTSIPQSMYWAIVTMTTVGFGDITPTTTTGKILTSIMIIIGYTLIIVPTGIVSAELSRSRPRDISTQVCRFCSAEGHLKDAIYCRKCGEKLNP